MLALLSLSRIKRKFIDKGCSNRSFGILNNIDNRYRHLSPPKLLINGDKY